MPLTRNNIPVQDLGAPLGIRRPYHEHYTEHAHEGKHNISNVDFLICYYSWTYGCTTHSYISTYRLISWKRRRSTWSGEWIIRCFNSCRSHCYDGSHRFDKSRCHLLRILCYICSAHYSIYIRNFTYWATICWIAHLYLINLCWGKPCFQSTSLWRREHYVFKRGNDLTNYRIYCIKPRILK